MRCSRIVLIVLAVALAGCGARFDTIPGPPEGAVMVSQGAAVAQAAPAPTDLAIPSIGVLTELIDLGLNPDHTVEVPEGPHIAGWYTGSPPPGQLGPAAIIGHVDSHEGPGVFYRLAELQPGTPIHIRRADDSVVTFVVERVERYPKDDFPTERVYGNTDGPELRLITCGGAFDPAQRSYRDNIVAYAVPAA